MYKKKTVQQPFPDYKSKQTKNKLQKRNTKNLNIISRKQRNDHIINKHVPEPTIYTTNKKQPACQ